MTDAVAGRSARKSSGKNLITSLARVVNPALTPLAASGLVPIWGLIYHTGRRSGRRYATPIAIRPTADGFILPLPFGENVDWCRNVLAADRATVRWHGRDHDVAAPRVIDFATAAPSFGRLRWGARLFGISRFLELRRV